MSHEEPRREYLPSRLSDITPASAIFARSERFDRSDRFDSTTYGPKSSSTEWIGRAWRRHWWQILPLWLLGATAVWFLSPRWLPNSYESTSVVEVISGSRGSGFDKNAGSEFSTFKETQARRIESPNIIEAALINQPELGKQLAVDLKTDPETAIRESIKATLQPNTHYIEVSVKAPKDDALAEIVDGVVNAFLKVAPDFMQEGAAQNSLILGSMVKAKEGQVKQKRSAVEKMVARMGTLDANQGRERHAAAIEQHATLSDQLLKIELEIPVEQANLDRVRQEEAQMVANPQSRVRTERQAVTAFYNRPEVIEIKTQQDQAEKNLRLAQREPGKTAEGSRKLLEQKILDLQRQIDNLYAKLKPELMIAADEAQDRMPLESSKIAAKLTGLKAQQAMLNDRLDEMNKKNLAGGSEVLALEFARQDLARAEVVLETMTQNVNRIEFESGQPVARFRQLFHAKTIEKSADLPRGVVRLVVPGVLLLGLLGFFGLIEKQMGRILDPSDLPSKVHLNVLGLVPPLPKSRTARLGLTSGAQQRSQVDVERFIQSLDQLRVVVCGRGDSQGRLRRSLLITSAGENEGKSTLAAQLAERSVNAGLVTLLIDADLRNPTLSRMFDRPESVGLANVLRGELLAEEAISVVPEAGGFHFLPAGLVRDDLSRLLQSDRLARLLESARESFDLVLVDSPPVLPVADALTIGQWVDGAILTVRHKVSRLPLVERASRQLSSVGISIIGAVVSGVKDRYAPYYGSRPSSDPDRGASVDSST